MEKYVVENFNRPDEHRLSKLSTFDVSTIYEAQGKFGLMNDNLKALQKNKNICGPAVTATCPAGDNLMIHAAIEVCKPGDVLVITTIGESKAGMIGELIIRALQERKVQGVIIEAGVRDIARIRELGFPVWGKTVRSEGTTKNRAGWVNATAVCGGVPINPGDIISADEDGIVVTAKEDIEIAIDSCEARMNKEADVKRRISDQELSVDFYGLREVLHNSGVQYYKSEEDLVNKHSSTLNK